MPPLVREKRQPGKCGIREDRQPQSPRASKTVADLAEEGAAERPTQKKRSLNNRAVLADFVICRAEISEQLRYEWRRHQRVEMHVQPVESPAKPGGDARTPLRP